MFDYGWDPVWIWPGSGSDLQEKNEKNGFGSYPWKKTPKSRSKLISTYSGLCPGSGYNSADIRIRIRKGIRVVMDPDRQPCLTIFIVSIYCPPILDCVRDLSITLLTYGSGSFLGWRGSESAALLNHIHCFRILSSYSGLCPESKVKKVKESKEQCISISKYEL